MLITICRYRKISVLFFILFFIVYILSNHNIVLAAAPEDEDYQEDGEYNVTAAVHEIGGIRYTLTGSHTGLMISKGNGTEIQEDSEDYCAWFSGNKIVIEDLDGDSFRLKSFQMKIMHSESINVRLTPSSGTPIDYAVGYDNVDVSSNSDFYNITSITFENTTDDTIIWLFLDELDFEEPFIPTYNVTYDGNGSTSGSVPVDGNNYNVGNTVTVMGNTGSLVKAGYTFSGWNTASNGSGTDYTSGNTFSISANNVTLYAKWSAIDYTVTYDGNGSTSGSVPVDSNNYNVGNTVTVLGNTGSLVKTGYTFSGWNTASNGSGTDYTSGNTFAMSTSNVTLYAKWSQDNYSLTYDSNGATGGTAPTDGSTYQYNTTAAVAGNTGTLVKAGYTFDGWNTSSNGNGTHYDPSDNMTMVGNTTLYAEWSATDYTVTYDRNGSTGGSVPVDSNNYNIGNTVTVLGNTGSLVKTGYTFSGWNTASNGSGTDYTSSNTFTMSTSNVTLYAKWNQDNYSLTYDSNGATGGTAPTDGSTYQYNTTVAVAGNTGTLVKTGYTFNGWNTAFNGSGTHYDPSDNITMLGNTTLYAEWSATDYTVTYDGNGSTGGSVPVDSNNYNLGNTVTVLGNTGSLMKTGYTFSGWNTASNGSGTDYASGNTFAMSTSNVTLYAKWSQDNYAITYDSNGATGGTAPVDTNTYNYNATTAAAVNVGMLIKDGYTFDGWNTSSDGSGVSYSTGASITILGNITLYAKWSPLGLTVSYNANGATGGTVPVDNNSYHQGDTVIVKGNSGLLVKQGYTFVGWSTQNNATGTTYKENNSILMGLSDIILYAKWEVSNSGETNQNEEDDNNPSKSNTSKVGAKVTINGEKKNVGNTTSSVKNGMSTVTVNFDHEWILDKIEAEEEQSTVTVQIDGNQDVLVGQLDGQIVDAMEEHDTVIEIVSENASYRIPASEIDINKISGALGSDLKLEDIIVEIEIGKASSKEIQVVRDVSSEDGFSIMVEPVSFTINCKCEDKTVEVNKFNAFVDRKIVIPNGVDPSKITTAIVVQEDGTIRHIPTKVIFENGTYYAQINSMTNSSYSLIYNEESFLDIYGHWCQDTIKNMASRLIVSGDDNGYFSPQSYISRGEFSQLIIKSLGLEESVGQNVIGNEDSKYDGFIGTMLEYGFVKGYEDGSFMSERYISREEAMVILEAVISRVNQDVIDQKMSSRTPDMGDKFYLDEDDISSWAKEAVNVCLYCDVVCGNYITLRPKDSMTRAEAVKLIENMLKLLELI